MTNPPMINDDDNIVPPGKIVCVPEKPFYADSIPHIVEPLRNKPHRPELGRHSFHCLPVVVGNQYGFVIKSMVSWTAIWNGGPDPKDTFIKIDDAKSAPDIQIVSSHFGAGIVTVQNRFSFRTPPGVNLMVLDPPNYFNFNLANLFAVVETDNLRRDFTFNLKIVEPKMRVRVKQGDIISAIIPIPRYFVDGFELAMAPDVFDPGVIREENIQAIKFQLRRDREDPHKPNAVGKLYWRGQDADGRDFTDHQKKLRKPT
jgi:hypothetical protein